MQARELSGTHIGARLTLTIGEAIITDTLTGVNHGADTYLDFTLNGKTTIELGRRRTSLTFLKAGEVRCPEASTVELLDPMHDGSR